MNEDAVKRKRTIIVVEVDGGTKAILKSEAARQGRTLSNMLKLWLTAQATRIQRRTK